MNTHQKQMKLSAVALAVVSVLNAMPAHAGDDVEVLTTRPSSIEVGIANASGANAAFGEYNGLNKSGSSLVGNLHIQGGDAFDSGGTSRWSIKGSDLGLSSRSLEANFGSQGQWNIGLGYDEFKHQLSDTYQTPYLGSNGGNSFSLPAGFGAVPTAPAGSTTINLTAAQKAMFQTMGIDSGRKNTFFSAGLGLNKQTEIKFEFNRLDQSGAKLMGFGATKIGLSTGEAVSILPNPTNYQTDTFNLALNWNTDKGHLTGAYHGSLFREGYDRVRFQSYAGAITDQTMSTMPSNQFHQFSLAGGYTLAPKTKVVGSVSYARNTQNDAYVVDPIMYVPGSTATGNKLSSLNGLVVNTHADLKMTDRSVKDLTLTAGLRYDERDNRTPSNIYNLTAISGQHIYAYPNTPLSLKKGQIEFAGDYRIKRNHSVRIAFIHEEMNRWCSQYAVNAGYPAGTNCVVATSHKDNKLDATYKMRPSEDVDLRLGYAYDVRKTNSDPLARAAMIGTNGGGIAGLNAGDFVGFSPYFDASRKQHIGKANANWQLNRQLALTVGGRLTVDAYDSQLGVQDGKTWSTNLDLTYAFSSTGSANLYLTRQHRERNLTDKQGLTAAAATATALSRPANATWSNLLTDDDVSMGVGVKQSGLMGNKLELTGNLAYIVGKTNYSTVLNYAGATTTGATCSASTILSCGALPEIKSTTTQLKLGGTYQVDKKSQVAVRYVYQRLNANDFYYNGYQMGYSPTTMLPTNQLVGNYSVNMFAVSYIHSF